MLLQQERTDVGKSGVLETARATVKATSKVFSFFSDNVYSNKFVAITRELVANAWDSHQMAGKVKTPVEVWLPTLIDPVFKVRDYGIGMSHEFVMGPFMAYADGSTKDNSNDVIGGFGIGSKSPFAYTDQFTIKSVHGGVESVYSVFKDEDGVPAVALLNQRTTSEPNGVETSFPVEVGDFPSFEEAAFKALRYFDPLPNIVNATSGAFEPVQYASRGKMWGMRKTQGDLQIVQGGVMYPVTAANLTYKFKDEVARKLLTFGLDIYVPIGTCSVALNREALSYNDTTIKNLEQVCLSVVDEVAKSFATMFDSNPSWWDARAALWREIYPTSSGYGYRGASVRGQFLADKAVYKGKKLEPSFHIPIIKGGMQLWILDSRSRRRNSTGVPNPKWENYPDDGSAHAPLVSPGRLEFVIIDDLPRSPKSKTIGRIKEYITDNLTQQDDIMIFRPLDDTFKPTDILDILGNPSNYELTSNMPEPVRAIGTSGGTVRPRIRMFTFDCQKRYDSYRGYYRYDTINPGQNGKDGVKEIDYALQPDKGIVVTTETYKLPSNFYNTLDAGLIDASELHFITRGDRKKLSDKWIDFEDEFQKRLKAKLKAIPELGARLAVQNHMPDSWQEIFKKGKTFNIKDKNNPMVQLQEMYDKYIKPLDKVQLGLAQFVTVALPSGVDPEKLVQDFSKRYPRAFRVLELTRFSPSDLDREIIVSLV